MSIVPVNNNYKEIFHHSEKPSFIPTQDWDKIGQRIHDNCESWDRTQKIKKEKKILPFSMLVVASAKNDQARVFIFPTKKKIRLLCSRTNKKVKRAYDLSTSSLVVYKEFHSNEKRIAEKLKNVEGVITPIGFYSYVGKNGKTKHRMFEPLYEGHLGQFPREKISSEQLSSIFKQLIHGLIAVQSIKVHKNQKFISFHGDIKQDNIFVRGDEVVLADFGLANLVEHTAGTYPYCSPEYCSLILNNIPKKEYVKKHGEIGCYNDVWALGLVFACLLSVKRSADLLNYNSVIDVQTAIRLLTQEKIDSELSVYPRKKDDEIRKKLWEITKGFLQVDPAAQLTLSEAEQMVK